MTTSSEQIVALGFLSNIVLATAKFIAGWAFDSKSLTADGWHSITDLAMDAVTAVTIYLSSKHMQKKLGWAFAIVDSFGAFFISGMMLAGGAQSAWRSGIDLRTWLDSTEAAVVNHQRLELHVLWVPIITIIIKEWLYATTMKRARETASTVLAASAAHHRADSWVGMFVLAAVLGSSVFTKAEWIDSMGGILLSAVVIYEGSGKAFAALCKVF